MKQDLDNAIEDFTLAAVMLQNDVIALTKALETIVTSLRSELHGASPRHNPDVPQDVVRRD